MVNWIDWVGSCWKIRIIAIKNICCTNLLFLCRNTQEEKRIHKKCVLQRFLPISLNHLAFYYALQASVRKLGGDD